MKTLIAVLASLAFLSPAFACERAAVICAALGEAPPADVANPGTWASQDYDDYDGVGPVYESPDEAIYDYWAAWTPVPDGSGLYINSDGEEEFVPLSPEAEAWLAEEQAMYEEQQAHAAAVQAYLDERDAQMAEEAIGLGMLDEMLNATD